MNWIFDIFNGGVNKKAEQTNKEQEFERKMEASDWIEETMKIDEAELTKEAAYQLGDTSEDTIEKDYKLALSGMSDYNLAEMLAELNTAADQLATLDFNEEKEKILKSVKSNRSSVESKILSMIGEHTSVDWKEAFKKFEDVDHVEPSEKDLYDQMPSGKWRKKVKFDSLSDKERVKQMEGVGKEEEKGALAKDASKTEFVTCPTCDSKAARKHEDGSVTCVTCDHGIEEKKASLVKQAYHIGDKVYYHGHPAVIKDMILNPHALEVSVTVEVDGEELHISGKELKEIGNEPLMEDLQHQDAPAMSPELAPEMSPEIEKKPEDVLPIVDEPVMAKKEAAVEAAPVETQPVAEQKEADIEVDAAANAAVIDAFVNGHAEDMGVKSSNLYMRPIISGVELVNYQTVIAVRVDDTIKLSTLNYSPTTSKIQRAIQSAAEASGKPIVSMETGQPVDNSAKREPAKFDKLQPGQKYDRLSSQEPEIETKASKADVIKKFALLSRHAEINSPWGVVKNEKGEEIVARVAPTLREKKSKEKNKKVDINSKENI